MYYLDADTFYDGDIHEERKVLMKWGHTENNGVVIEALRRPDVFSFTFVRNPYRRLLSAFSDKMFGYQSHGGRYGGGALHAAAEPFGMRFDGTSNIFNSFLGFVRYVEAALQGKAPRDIHWAPSSQHLRFNLRFTPSWNLHHIGYVEHLAKDLASGLTQAGIDRGSIPQNLPRENATSIGFSCERMFSAEAISIVKKIYAEDFEVFGYDADISNAEPSSKREAAEVYDRLQHIYRRRGIKA